jgi:hypothetical protein
MEVAFGKPNVSYNTGCFNTLDAFTALRFTATGAPPVAKHMRIVLMNQHADNIVDKSHVMLKMLSLCT